MHHLASYSCRPQGTWSHSQSIPPLRQVRASWTLRGTRMTGRWLRRVATKAKATRPQCPLQPTSDPLDRTAEKRFYGNPLRSREALGRPIAFCRCPRRRFRPSLMLRPRPPPPPWPRPFFLRRVRACALCPARSQPRARSRGQEQGRRGRLQPSVNLRSKERGQRAGPEPPEPGLPATPQSGRGK